ncbi:hypothetical protein E3T24_04440 [Cryobacterium sp. TmT2-59]|uniref:O-antigen ligase family protein n=1 Tax=Cryobacterium sp. TmT2-59 TaxID=1259264 RepID=UPI00106A2417|nr:hypothetical protein [Cryobacterium sp. TmT2-59]TFC87659.1 hypothetical protein E3T24_04440 [Cryobacterium sp. TmT2-59]
MRSSSLLTRFSIPLSLAYLMLRPVGHNEVLLPVVGVLGAVSVWNVLTRHRAVSLEVGLVIGLTLAVGLYGSTIGIGNPGLANGMLVWLAGPLVFGAWAVSGDEPLLKVILTTSALATTIASLGIILYVGGSLGAIPQVIPLSIIQESGGGFDGTGETTTIRFYGLSTLVAAAPMWVTAAVLPTHRLLPSRALALLGAVTATTAALLAGRDAIVLVLILIPLAMWLLARYLRRAKQRRISSRLVLTGLATFIVALFALPTILANPSLRRTWESVIAYFTGTATASADESLRDEQVTQLIRAWSESPIFGHGWGATIDGYARSQERPWNFEMQYHLLLFQVGLVGAVVLLLAVFVAASAFVRAARRRPDLLPILLVSGAAASAMLVANATNPYLQAPGHMWAVYLVLMTINIASYPVTEKPIEGERALTRYIGVTA